MITIMEIMTMDIAMDLQKKLRRRDLKPK